MYDLVAHGAMIADKGRVSAYARALERLVTPGAVVLDIGSGPGILALLACRAGAGRVYAVETTDVIEVARAAAAANGFADRIDFIQAASTDITLPERVDGLVSDLHGVLPLYRNAVMSILDARDRFLKPGGWLVPARESLWAAVVTSERAHAQIAGPWDIDYGLDLSTAQSRATSLYQGRRIEASELLTVPQSWTTLDYATLLKPAAAGELAWTIDRDAPGHGVAMWFDAEMADDIALSNSPLSGETHVYSQAFFAWPQAVALAKGDTVHLRVRADFAGGDYVWTWNTDVRGAAPASPVKASYRQSSFLGETTAPGRWSRRAHTYVANLGDDARIDRRILDLMERKMPLGDIASELLTMFPADFKDWDAALGRVGVLSDRYSR